MVYSIKTKSKAVRDNGHLKYPTLPYRMIVDEQATLHVFATKREYAEYLDSRDVELCRF